MPKRKTSPPKGMTTDEKHVESQWADVDFDHLTPVSLDLDPTIRERIRSRDRLRQITLRIGQDQIDEAKRVAKETNQKYQAVLRRWLAEGASRARAIKRKTGT